MNQLLIILGIIGGSFILEDPTTLAVGSMIANKEISFLLGFSALTLGIFLGDLGLYVLGLLFKKNIFSTEKNFYTPTLLQVAFARFLPGARTITFTASGYNGVSITKFLLVIFPSSVIWTLLLLLFTDKIYKFSHYFPMWINLILSLLFLVILAKLVLVMRAIILLLGGAFYYSFRYLIPAHYFSPICRGMTRLCGLKIELESATDKIFLSRKESFVVFLCLASVLKVKFHPDESEPFKLLKEGSILGSQEKKIKLIVTSSLQGSNN